MNYLNKCSEGSFYKNNYQKLAEESKSFSQLNNPYRQNTHLKPNNLIN